MKLSELFEGPYYHDQDWGATPAIKTKSWPSYEGLKRENYYLGELNNPDKYNFWLSKTLKNAKVTTERPDDIGNLRELVVCEIQFDNRADLPVKNELQVYTVYTDPEFRNKNLAMAMYVLLARYDYTVISDFDQYCGGKGLWKKMASESSARKFVIRIWSDQLEDWIKDDEGTPIKYDGANVNDFDIWNGRDRKYDPTSLLVLGSS